MDSTTALVIIVVIFAIVVLAALWRYRRQGEASIEVGGVKVSVKGENEPQKSAPPQASPPASSTTPGVNIEDAKSRKGGILAEDNTGRGAHVPRVEVEDDIIAASGASRPRPKSLNPGGRGTQAVSIAGSSADGDMVAVVGSYTKYVTHIHPGAEPPLFVNVPPLPSQPLVGRDAMLDDLAARLIAGHSPALSTAGMPGVGKTALAVALAHHRQVLAHFSDGVLWAGLGQQPDIASIQAAWATALAATATCPRSPTRANARRPSPTPWASAACSLSWMTPGARRTPTCCGAAATPYTC